MVAIGTSAGSSRKRHGPFHQGRDLIEQGVGDHRHAAEALSLGRHALADGLAPLVDVGQDLAAPVQRRDVGRGRRDAQRLRCHEAMAEGQVRRGDAQHLAGHHILAEQHQHPVHRAYELRLAGAPAHAPGDRQCVERGLHDARQQARGRRARLGAAIHQPRALRRLEALERPDLDAASLREGEGCLHRRALRIEGRLDRRTAALDRAIGLSLREPAHAHREPPRCGEALDGTVLEPGLAESPGDSVGKRSGQCQQRLRRQFLSADLDQEIAAAGAHRVASAVGTALVSAWRDAERTPFSIGKPSASRLAW
jgi:hypothetical protein